MSTSGACRMSPRTERAVVAHGDILRHVVYGHNAAVVSRSL